ncbi:MAG: thioredoxin-disulfide reductase [Pseudomonadota bacterium]
MGEKIVIIGAGPSGLTAAIYAARANLNPLVIEGLTPGGQLTITMDVENYPGFAEPITGPELMAAMRKQAERIGARFKTGEVTAANLKNLPIIISVGDEKIEAKALIIATGANVRWLGLESETALRGKGVSACATCDGFFYKGKEVCVVGGGDTAVEEALYLTNFCSKVTIIHRRDELRASQILRERAKQNPKIEFAWNSVVDEILDVSKEEVKAVRLKHAKTGKLREVACDGVFIAIGHVPNTKVFKGQLEMDENGYIITTKISTVTSVPGVFAAGDCQDSVYRQAVTATGTGCMAAIDAERYLQNQ